MAVAEPQQPIDTGREAFSPDAPNLRADLEAILSPDQVMTGALDRLAYANDASVYRKVPQGVVQPRSIDEVIRLFRLSHERRIPLTFRAAGTSQLTIDGTTIMKNWVNSTLPFCHTINVVMSPKGENAPPALAATTILMQASATNLRFEAAMAMTTAPMRRAVVRLSAIGERKKASSPVLQKIPRREKPFETSQARSA